MSRVARPLSIVAGGAVVAPPGERVAAPERPAEAGDVARLPAAERTLSELFSTHPRDAGWAGFLLAHPRRPGPVLWVQDRMAILESGRIFPPGLPISDLVHVEARDARGALWAMEEGLRCSALSLVIGEIWGDPAALDFTATRRLAVAAERYGVAAYLVRLGGHANLSGARMRWRITSAPSGQHPLDPKAPGAAAWDAELFRARGFAPGRWSIACDAQRQGTLVSHETSADRRNLVAAAADRTLVEGERRVG
jgi:protein ImuA